jgi:hypothetical protein
VKFPNVLKVLLFFERASKDGHMNEPARAKAVQEPAM